ncbi:MAG: hypothetical protein U1F18_07615 [Steroidobacteraceae bacterium]
MRRWRVLKFAAALPLGLAVIALIAGAVMLLWNALIPALFQGPVLTFWQAAGLLLLMRLLVGFRGRGHGARWIGGHHAWRQRMNARWQSMSPEDREAFRQQLRARYAGRCGGAGNDDSRSAGPAAPVT